MVELIKERSSYTIVRHLETVEWQTKTIATFLALTAQSTEAMKAMNDAVQKISIFGDKSDKKSLTTGGSAPEPRAGSAEKLAMLFGRRGAQPK
jgi:hypothetical protein